LCRRTTGAGIRHDVHRVHGVLLDFIAFGIDHGVLAQAFHHRLRNLFIGTRPDIDHLVVTFARSDQPRGVLILDFQDFLFRLFQNGRFGFRNGQVIDADGHAGHRRVAETGVHQLVSQHNSVLDAQLVVAHVQQSGNVLLGQHLVDVLERQPFGQDLGQQGAANRGVYDFRFFHPVAVFIPAFPFWLMSSRVM